ncbi:Uncharacterised protein [uncultured Ruminococcus sp.]|nr:Uncharacterised protein [uncultured Ruminococcus sp.]
MNVFCQRLFRFVETSRQVFVFAADKIGLDRKGVGVYQPYIRSGKLPQPFRRLFQLPRQGMIEGQWRRRAEGPWQDEVVRRREKLPGALDVLRHSGKIRVRAETFHHLGIGRVVQALGGVGEFRLDAVRQNGKIFDSEEPLAAAEGV